MGLLILLPGWFSIPHNQFRYPGPVLLSPPHHWKIQQLSESRFNENIKGHTGTVVLQRKGSVLWIQSRSDPKLLANF